MKSQLIRIACFAVVSLLLGSTFAAQDAKDKAKEKAKAKPAEPIVVSGEILNVDLKDKVTNSHCKTFTFKMEKDKGYLLELASQTFQPYLRIENGAGQVGAAGTGRFDPAGGQSSFFVHRPAKTEDFEIVVTSQFQNQTGRFTLTIKELSGEEGKPIDLKLQNGQVAHNGVILPTDPRYGNKIAKTFIVELEKGSTYQIDHASKAMDAYLYLLDPNGRVLAQNDDFVGLDSRINHRATESGKYRIVATSLGGQSTGPFTFSVRLTAGQPEKK